MLLSKMTRCIQEIVIPTQHFDVPNNESKNIATTPAVPFSAVQATIQVKWRRCRQQTTMSSYRHVFSDQRAATEVHGRFRLYLQFCYRWCIV